MWQLAQCIKNVICDLMFPFNLFCSPKVDFSKHKITFLCCNRRYLDYIQEYRNNLELPLRLWVAFFLFLFLINFLFNFFLFFPWLMFPCSPLCPKRRCAVIWKRKLVSFKRNLVSILKVAKSQGVAFIFTVKAPKKAIWII